MTRGLLRAALLLTFLTLAAYWPVRDAAFVDFDDGTYVTGNPLVLRGLSREGVRWAFTTPAGSNWHPLAWLSHMADVALYGAAPGGHHLTNLLLHVVNTLLVLGTLAAATGSPGRSALVAGLFALHPTHVESVAWIAERKDVLSTTFGWLALHA